MTDRRAYTDEQKAEALAMYVDLGAAETAKRLQIPKGTLSSWAKRAGVQTVAAERMRAATEMRSAQFEERRVELRHRLVDELHDLLDRLHQEHIDFRGKDSDRVTFPQATSADVRNYSIAFGVFLDKLRLELGEATDRTERTEMTESEAIKRAARALGVPEDQVVNELAERRRKKSA